MKEQDKLSRREFLGVPGASTLAADKLRLWFVNDI